MVSKNALLAATILLCVAALPALAVTAFPGAEGYGANVTGGRGGTVYHVTNLNDSGSGSLRNASAMSNVTIVFDVGGYINSASKLGFTGTNVTVAGQTAPGGIGVKGSGVSIGADNMIIRHMRMRPGKATSASDALNINSNVSGLMVDHCSINFSTDENNSMDNPTNVTVQWTTNAWGLQTHSCGSLLYSAGGVTVHHGLWAHNHTRNPKHRNSTLDWVNNVIFDWDIPFICADATSGTHSSNVVGCYFIAGGSTDVFTSAQMDAVTGLPTYHMYLSNTLTDLNLNGVLDGTDKGTTLNGNIDYVATRFSTPQVATTDALTAHKMVVSNTGATPWTRDEVDTVLFNDLTTQTRRILTRESDLPVSNSGFGTLGGGTYPTDTDRDGMPDFFETALGLNPAIADNNGDYDGDGYTNLEHYLNWLGGPHAQVISGASVDVGLRQFTSGFATTATYTVSGATNGTVSLLVDGKTARFTPTAGFSGLGKFDYTVNDGSTASGTVTVLVQGSGAAIPLAPDPMTWASAPAAAGLTSITMTATTASSSGGVDYYFTCTAGGGHDSAWQTSSTYVDSGLQPATTYTYRVKARDKVDTAMETSPSQALSATTRSIPAIAAPAAYWQLDETSGTIAHDISGAPALNGTLGGTGLPTWAAGKFGNGLTFTANGGRVTVPSSSTIDFGDENLSLSIWIKEPVTIPVSTQHEIFVKGTFAGTYDTGSGKRYEFYRKRDTTSDNFRWTIDDNVTKTDCPIAASLVCTGDWVNVIGVRDTAANQLRIYVNGVLKNTVTDASGSISQTEPLYLGDVGMSASLDEVRIYRYALSDDQIMAIYLGSGVTDVTSPSPNPTTWAVEPHATSYDSISMTATTAVDISGVEYYFGCLTDGGHDSGWQDSPTYTDTGLANNTSYLYAAVARDKSPQQNSTGVSPEVSATTLRFICNDPIQADLNGDCRVDLLDVAIFANAYAAGDTGSNANLNGDEMIDFLDIVILVDEWLVCNRLPAEECLW